MVDISFTQLKDSIDLAHRDIIERASDNLREGFYDEKRNVAAEKLLQAGYLVQGHIDGEVDLDHDEFYKIVTFVENIEGKNFEL